VSVFLDLLEYYYHYYSKEKILASSQTILPYLL